MVSRHQTLFASQELEKNGGPSPEPQQANSLVNKKSVNEVRGL